ncbi:MAG: FAD-dependent thymidylate synthase [Actinomycetia bacterium]|nr:FAD-dependent thymidylate synthase [Actinomycetes bacterium]
MIKAEYISHMGSDTTVVNAARVSFAKEVEGMDSKDAKLIEYLAKHNHWTPFSHPQIMIRETVPIFVARQRFKHMVGFTYNEVSRRYVDDTPEFFYPEGWRSRPEGSAKQGSSSEFVEENDLTSTAYKKHIKNSVDLYNDMLYNGVAPEMARMVLPQSMLTSYYVTGSLSAWARMVKQRTDDHAQVEIRELAKAVEYIIASRFPISWEALTK